MKPWDLMADAGTVAAGLERRLDRLGGLQQHLAWKSFQLPSLNALFLGLHLARCTAMSSRAPFSFMVASEKQAWAGHVTALVQGNRCFYVEHIKYQNTWTGR